MKKKLCVVVIIIFAFFSINMLKKNIEIDSKAALLMDAETGEILFEKNANTSYPVASMSKLMSELIVLEQIEGGTIHWDDLVLLSGTANEVEAYAVTVAIPAGTYVTVRDLFKAMVITSANNATIALAEHIAGSEQQFTHLMNEKAKELGLSRGATFVNATGLPIEGLHEQHNQMSAKDVGKLTYYLLQNYQEEVLDISSRKQDQILSQQMNLVSTNKLLDNGQADWHVDGLKTGFTDAAGYCFVSTAYQEDKRLISVIMGAKDDEIRFIETEKLFSFGFTNEKIKDLGISRGE